MTAPAEKHGQITNSPQQYLPYPVYKDVGVEWLREIPAHWEVRRLKDWVTINRSVLPETTDPDFVFQYIDIGSVSTGVLTKKPQRMRFAASPSRARRIVREGDTIISTVRTYLKAVWFAQETHDNLICSTGFAVLTPDERAVPKFVSYLVQSHPFIEQVTANSVGMSYPAIAESRLGSFHLPLPPLPEQAAIVRYLDYVERRIRRYIDAKQKLVGLLEELKQATIYEAVTRGLDPDVPLKPSGIEWLGDVPAHWALRQLKLSVTHSTEQTNKRHEHEIYLALEHVESWTGRYSDAGPDVVFDSQVKRFRAGDVLFGKLRPYLAKVARPDRDGVCVGEFLVLRPCGCAMSPEYLKWLLRTKPVIDAINASTYGAKMPRTNWRFIGSMKQPLPPRTRSHRRISGQGDHQH